MSGTRQDGILLVDDLDGGGGTGVAVSITEPIGSNTTADSLSVTLATDSPPLPVSGDVTVSGTVSVDNFPPVSGTVSVDNFPAVQPVSATDLDIRNLNSANDSVTVTGTVAVSGGTISASNDQGAPNTVANSWPIKITDGTHIASVATNGEIDASSRGLLVAGLDSPNSTLNILPVVSSNWARPTISNGAVSVVMRNARELSGSSPANTNDMITVGGGQNTAESIPNPRRLVLGDGETFGLGGLPNDPASTFGLQVRELGQSFGTSGNISAVSQRATISSRYVVKTAAIFVLTDLSFIGTLRPVVSIDNGTTWAYCAAVNIETLAVASSYVNSAVAGSFAIPFGNGATNYGFEITARTSGSITWRVSANTQGQNSVFTLARPLTAATDTLTSNQGSPNTEANAWPVLLSDGTNHAGLLPISGPSGSGYGLVTQSLCYGKSTAGGGSYEEVKVSPSGALQVDAAVSNFPATQVVSATDLDIRNLVFATDKVDVSGSTVTTSGTATVSGTVSVSNFPATQAVSATDLDIRNLAFATDKVDVSGSSISVTGTTTVSGSVSVSNFPATQPISGSVSVSNFPSSQVVTATDLDIRDLAFATDKVDASGSSVSISGTATVSGSVSVSNFPATQAVSATDLDIRNLVFATDKVDVSNSTVTNTPASATTCNQTQVADSATSVTILASNSNRRGASIVNTSTVTLYLRLNASAATTSNYTVALVATAYYEVPFNYTGTITGIWASAPGTGNANVSEFV